MLKYKVIKTLYEMDEYEQLWTNILEKNNNDNPFVEFEWVMTWWEILGRSKQVEIYVVLNGEIPIAFFPLEHTKRFGIHHFRFVGEGDAHYMQVICERQCLEAATRFLFSQLEKKYGHFIFILSGLLESNDTSKVIEKYAIEKQYPYSLFRTVVPYINLKGNDSTLLMKNFKKRNKSIYRREKKLQSLGKLSFRPVTNERLDEMFVLYEKRWSKKLGTNISTNDKRMFYEILYQRTFPSIHVEVNQLLFENKWVSFTYDLCCRGRKVGLLIGHDPDFHVFGLGRMIDKENLAQAHERNYKIYDFGNGYEPYKFGWATDVDFTRKLILSTKGKRVRILRGLLAFQHSVKTYFKNSRKFVQFKRDTLGELRYLFKKGKLIEWKHYFSKLFKHTYIKSVEFYCYETSGIKATIPFKKLSLKKASSLHLPFIVDDYYRGFYLYQSDDETIQFKRNDQFIRDESVGFIEKLQKDATYIKDYSTKDLSTILINVGEETKVVWTSCRFLKFNRKKELEKLGFKCHQRIVKIKFFNIEKVISKKL